MADKKVIKKLADFIEKHPNCTFHIDNDNWYITNAKGKIITDNNKIFKGTSKEGDFDGYGGHLLYALAELMNRRGFQITVESV